MSKAFGRDINEYYNNHFPEDCYLDGYTEVYESWDEKYYDNNNNIHLPLDKKFELKEFGYLYDSIDMKLGSFESCFKRWLKKQSTATVVLEVAKDEYEQVVAKLKELGFKIIK